MNEAPRDISFLEMAIALGEEKKTFFLVPSVLCAIAILFVLIVTPVYTAETTLLPPQQQSSGGGLLDQLGPLAGLAMGGAMTGKGQSDLYVALLKSNTVRNMLIDKFKLQERYDVKTYTDARAELSKRISVSADVVSGLISVKAKDKDPEFAAQLANGHVPAVQELMGGLALSDAQRKRKFFKEQVDKLSREPFRDARIQELILASMIRQYETAKIDEAREGPLLQQVEVARPPEYRSFPKRSLTVVITGFVGLFLGALIVLQRRELRHLSAQPVGASRLSRLRKAWLVRGPR